MQQEWPCKEKVAVSGKSTQAAEAEMPSFTLFSAARGYMGLCFSLFKGQCGTLRTVKLLTWFLARSRHSVIFSFLSSCALKLKERWVK